MSGKGAGKKRNRAAQSEQHGYQEPQVDQSNKPGTGKTAGSGLEKNPEKQRVLEKLRDLQKRLRQKE